MPRISAERSQAQRLRLVEASVRVFAEQGYDATTVDAVCHACGLSKGAVYTYFSSKEELFLAASEHVFEQRYRVLIETLRRQEPRAAGVDGVLASFADSLARTDRSFLRLWVEGFLVAARMPALAELKTTYHRRFGDLIIDLLEAAQRTGELDQGLDAALAADALMSLADGLMLHGLVPGLGADADRASHAMSEVLAPLWRGKRP
jgi:AcrR family transcriptional regulator